MKRMRFHGMTCEGCVGESHRQALLPDTPRRAELVRLTRGSYQPPHENAPCIESSTTNENDDRREACMCWCAPQRLDWSADTEPETATDPDLEPDDDEDECCKNDPWASTKEYRD